MITRKYIFLTEQLSLVFSKPNTRRYPSSLLAMAFMWQSVSPALYGQIDSDGVLTIPSVIHVRELTSAVGNNLKLTNPARHYLQARFSKLSPDDHQVSLLMDEVYCKQTLQVSLLMDEVYCKQTLQVSLLMDEVYCKQTLQVSLLMDEVYCKQTLQVSLLMDEVYCKQTLHVSLLMDEVYCKQTVQVSLLMDEVYCKQTLHVSLLMDEVYCKQTVQVSLLMDEVYCKQTVQYTNGKFYGADNNETTKTLLCVMVKSVCGKYREVVSMTQISNINADKLHRVWENCISVLSEIGFIVVVTMTDGHKSNEIFFKKLFGRENEHFLIEHPCFPGQKIFLLIDPIHPFKNFYNNFMVYEIFSYPNFQDIVDSGTTSNIFQANFAHIRQLCDLELGKPVKGAHKLNDKVLNPYTSEKTSVKFADAVFHESTINTLIYYSEHGYAEFLGTAKFLQIIRDWFNTMNVKSAYNGQKTRNKRKECFGDENRNEVTDYLIKFYTWLKKWQEDPNLKGFSKPTFNAAIQTPGAVPKLLNYLLDNMRLEFILTVHIQSDFLESRFGWYRQLCGANYCNTVLQFLQAVKTIRIRSLVKMGFSLSDIKGIFENKDTESADLDSNVIEMLENVENFTFEELQKEEDQAIV